VLAAAAGTITLALLYRRIYSIARAFAVAAVGAVVAAWGVGQYPWIVVDQLAITQAAGADATLAGLLVVVALAVLVVLPAFGYLLLLTQNREVEPNPRALVRSMSRRCIHDPSAVHADDGRR